MDPLQVFLLSTVGHLLGDFAFQRTPVALKKEGVNRYMLEHVFIVSLTTVLPMLLIEISLRMLLAFLIVLFTHLVVDNIKNYFVKRTEKEAFWKILAFDQIFHVCVIYLLLWWL